MFRDVLDLGASAGIPAFVSGAQFKKQLRLIWPRTRTWVWMFAQRGTRVKLASRQAQVSLVETVKETRRFFRLETADNHAVLVIRAW